MRSAPGTIIIIIILKIIVAHILETLIHNAPRPRRPRLWIRVLVCPWEGFSKQGEYDLGSIGIWSVSERQVVKRRHVGSKCQAHGSEKVIPNRCFGHQVCSISDYFRMQF